MPEKNSKPLAKILIIPDIHTKFQLAQKIIQKEKADKIVFLGDYFDDLGDNPEITRKTALWLKDSLEKPNRIHLIGNHDLSYLNTKFNVTGFTEEKLVAIKSTRVDLSKLSHFCWVGDWLCTHAGLSNDFYKSFADGATVDDFLKQYTSDEKLREILYSCSNFRGGLDPFGGIVWCDYDEFVDIPNLKQVFGHTRDSNVRWEKNEDNSEHICLDTVLQNYAIFQNNTMTVKSVN